MDFEQSLYLSLFCFVLSWHMPLWSQYGVRLPLLSLSSEHFPRVLISLRIVLLLSPSCLFCFALEVSSDLNCSGRCFPDSHSDLESRARLPRSRVPFSSGTVLPSASSSTILCWCIFVCTGHQVQTFQAFCIFLDLSS